MYDNDNICWHDHRDDSWRCKIKHRSDLRVHWGRCRSGKRWFWAAHPFRIDSDNTNDHYGWESSEAEAIAAVRTAIKQMSEGKKAAAYFQAGTASYALRRVNKVKLAARLAAYPSSVKDSNAVEYLYAYEGCNGEMSQFCPCHQMSVTDSWNYHTVKFTIIKKTKQRIYYNRRPLDFIERDYASGIVDLTEYGTAYIDRQEIEQAGEIWSHKSGGWWEADCRLYLIPPPPPDWRIIQPEASEDLQTLKAEMAAAHPDRGGSNAAFIEARKRYVEARARLERNAG